MATIVEMYIEEGTDLKLVQGPIPVEPLNDGRYRICGACFVDDVEYRDVVEVERIKENTIRIKRVVEKGGWITHGYCIAKHVIESESMSKFLESVVARGGEWENIFGGMLFIYLPPGDTWNPGDEIGKLGEQQ